MSKFVNKSTPTIEGPMIVEPALLGEDRSWLKSLEQSDVYESMNLEVTFVDRYEERLARGVVRGLHFQRKDSYGRLVAVKAGRILCVVVDLRPESKSFGAANSVELSSDNERMLYLPPYFALGYLTLEAASEVVCLCAGEYTPAEESGIIYDDEILAIDWQYERYEIDQKRLNISQRDRKLPSFRSYNQNTLWINRPKKSRYALSR
ncbi:MAG: dTDP-4-dehydrorhamnose 3,5-epimerase [Rikenellaceae bacterium]